MEVGQTATAGQRYNKRWDTVAQREPFYSAENWKDSSSSNTSSWKVGAAATGGGGVGTATHAWSDGVGTPASSSSPSSLSSLLPIIGTDGSVDKMLYQNLVEMIPLVETFMDQQNNKSFPRHASLIYTPTPSRDALPLKKNVQAVEHPLKGKKGHGQILRGKRGEVKDSLFWDNGENIYHDNRDLFPEEIPMLSFPTDYQVDQNAVTKAIIAQLQSQIEQLEQKLQEKDSQLQAAENLSQQVDLLRLQASVEELQKQILMKEQEIQKAINQLSGKQHEVASLHSLLEKAGADVEVSNLNVAKVHEELHTLQCQVAAFLLQMQSFSSSLDNDEAADEPGSSSTTAIPTMQNGQADQMTASQMHESEAEHVELTRRKYLASIIAARENPSEELLLLVTELRVQLQAYLMRPDTTSVPSDVLVGMQSSKFSLR